MDFALTLRDRQNLANDVCEDTLGELQKRGHDLYRRKQYEAALECFTQAISQDAHAPVNTLNSRAATYIKLGNLQAGLRDARQMILQEKANITGYLRAGQILQLQGNQKMALDLYEMGIRRVTPTDRDVKVLRGIYEKVVKQLAPPKAIDPLQVLPMELAEMTIKYLSFRQIVRLTRVSKSWQQLLFSTPGLWNNIDLLGANKPVSRGAFRRYMKTSRGLVTRVTLDKFGTNHDSILSYLAERCKSLQELTIPAGLIGASLLKAVDLAPNLKSIVISFQCQISLDTVTHVLSKCRGLERAEFWNVKSGRFLQLWEGDLPMLRALILNGSMENKYSRSIPGMNVLMKKINNIVDLSLQNWFIRPNYSQATADFSCLAKLQNLKIARLGTAVVPQLPPSLRTLLMEENCYTRPLSHNSAHHDLPYLVHLSMAGWHNLTFVELLSWLESSKGKITRLDISDCFMLQSDNFQELVQLGYLDQVEELNLNKSSVDDAAVTLLSRRASSLKSLELARTKISGIGVKALVTGLPGKLKYLNLSDCRSTSVDAVDFARSRGVTVSYSFADAAGKGKKVTLRE